MIAFWLLPAADEREFFRATISRLAADYDAPAFEPHVTLAAGDYDRQTALRCLAATSATPIRLRAQAIRFSEAFTQTVFVPFYPSSAAADLSATIVRTLGAAGAYHFDPHLSLIYKTMPAEQKKVIALEIDLPFAQVNFDSIRVIEGPSQTLSRADVEAWRTLADAPIKQIEIGGNAICPD